MAKKKTAQKTAKKPAQKIVKKADPKAAAPVTALDMKRGTREIAENKLERFPNRNTRRPYRVEFTCPEFTALCPKTGFPDFATIYIRYMPDEFCVELKSLKLYINSFRDKGVFHEDVTNIIADDLIDLLDPNEIEIVADFTRRGNIHTVVTVQHSKSSSKMPNDEAE